MTTTERTGTTPGQGADPQLVRMLRAQVADRLNQQRRSDEVLGRTPMSPEDERQFARSLIVQVLEDHARAEITLGEFVDLDEALRRLALVTADDVQSLAVDLAAGPLSIAAVGALDDDVFAGILPASVRP